MSLYDQLVKLGKTRKELRPHIRPVLAELQKEAAQMYSHEGLVENLAEAARNEGRYYKSRDAKGAVNEAAKRITKQFMRDVRDAKRDAIREVQRVWDAK